MGPFWVVECRGGQGRGRGRERRRLHLKYLVFYAIIDKRNTGGEFGECLGVILQRIGRPRGPLCRDQVCHGDAGRRGPVERKMVPAIGKFGRILVQ